MSSIESISATSAVGNGPKAVLSDPPDGPVLPPALNNYVQVWFIEATTAVQTAEAILSLKNGGAVSIIPDHDPTVTAKSVSAAQAEQPA